MGYRAITWSFMESYIRTFRALVRGEIVEWEGTQMQMLHPEPRARPARRRPRPRRVPRAQGQRRRARARRLFATLQLPDFLREYGWVPYLAWGTVLDEGEPPDSEHARETGGAGWALAYHGAYEFGGPGAVRGLPGGAEWLDTVEKAPEASATSPCTPGTASSSTTPTAPPGRPAGTRCSPT